MRGAATNAAALLSLRDAPEFELDLVDAIDELAHNGAQTCGIGRQQPRIDALHLVDQILHIAVCFARDILIAA